MRETLGYKKNHEDREENDFYATDPNEVYNICSYEKLIGTVLEPSCGMGHMVKGIQKHKAYENIKIVATDLIDRGFGESGYNFLDYNYPYVNDIGTIIMNPPFKFIEEFVVKSIEIAQHKVILLARNQFLEGGGRYNNIFSKTPPARIYQYVDRIACAKDGNFKRNMISNMAFSWFIWDKDTYDGNTYMKWIRKFKDNDNCVNLF